jgi:hypothetical protein
MAMAEPARILPQAPAPGATRADPAAGGRRPSPPARLRCRGEPDTAPETADQAADYTGFSMVGVAG